MNLEFTGKSIMVEKISAAVRGDCPKAITACSQGMRCAN